MLYYNYSIYSHLYICLFMCLTGPIPEGISSMVTLQTLSLSKNQLTGQVPTGISCLTNMQSLDLADNKLRGETCSRTRPFPQK